MRVKESERALSDTALRSIDNDYLIKLTMDLVNIESPTGKEREVAEFYRNQLSELGFKTTLQEVEADRYNVLAIMKGSGGGPTLMFNGHLDTSFSPREDPKILRAISPVYRTEPPWCYREGDWLYGMGVFNMKGALAAYAACAKSIQDASVELKGDIMIAGVVGEIEKTQIDRFQGPEYRGYGTGTAHLVTHGGTADAAILGEPTGLRLMRAHFGSVWAKISIGGTLVHTAHATGVQNAILQMTKVVEAIQKWIPDYQRRFEYQSVKPSVNLGSIEGGWPWRASRTPAFCNLYLDVRYPPRRHPLDLKQELQVILSDLRDKEGIDADLELYVSDTWAELSEDEYILKSLSQAHERVFEKPVESVVFSWSSDANILTRNGVAAVNYGPTGGPGKETRGTCYIPNLIGCTKVYTLAALDFCSKRREEVRRSSYL